MSIATVASAEDLDARLLLADVPQEIRESVAESVSDPRDIPDAVLQASKGYLIDAGLARVFTDRRWYGTVSASGSTGPFLEIRRWPGDGVFALYALEGETEAGSHAQTIPGAILVEKGSGSLERREWDGELRVELGTRRIVWIESPVPDVDRRVGALLLPGDAGLGPGGLAAIEEEMRAILDRVELVSDGWRVGDAIARNVPIALPEVPGAPGIGDERSDPWQVLGATEFSIGLPPGLLARTTDGAVPAPVPVEGGRLWIRGRFLDRDGATVLVGSASRAGYVARVENPPPDWRKDEAVPIGAPGAERVRNDAFSTSELERTGAQAITVSRWKEPGFPGDWLVFRLRFEGWGEEIALPVVEGWRSPALFWMPLTRRPAGATPAPPPLDPAERFGIRFEQFGPAERRRRPLSSGFLTAPGLRVELPRDWWPVASLRTADGFPILLLDAGGTTAARIDRLGAGEVEVVLGNGTWTQMGGARRFGAAAAWERERDGARLWVSREGHAFLLRGETTVTEDAWKRLVGGVELLRSGARPEPE